MSELAARLTEIVGLENLGSDAAVREKYGRDWTRFFPPVPSFVVFPRNIEIVLRLVKFANEAKISLVPSGGRTGLSGGAVATDGEIVVSFEKMNQVLQFNEVDNTVVVEPGLITQQLQEFATQKGLFYPVDFASSGSSQIGGNIATNAGGIKVLRYGLTRDWVRGLKVVTGSGELLDLNKGLIKNATGYDLRHLFIGSEGT
ncbi:MAG TPA: FAD-binding oxidoreductase, partial [Pseudomonadales bacterium]|nr:FAD-binding oxidoreductase [Pseudomonadales bacterium]